MISFTGSGVTYTENFDTLVNTGTSSTLPTGFVISEAGTNANSNYTAGTGSGNGGETYSFGSTGSADRALGELTSGSLISTFGASVTNNSGATISSLLISYVGEQWRSGDTAAVVDRLDFQYSLDATSLTTGTWINIDALDFSSIITTAAAGALDGNLTANRTALSSDITGLTIADGATIWVRWVSVNITGSDDGLAVDDLSITPTTASPLGTSLSIGDASVTEGNSGATDISFTVIRAGSAVGAVSADYTIAGNTADAADFVGGAFPSGTVTFADSETSKVITLSISGDADVEPSETFTVTLSNSVPGTVTFSDAAATGTITNDDFSLIEIYDIQGAGHTSSFAGQTVQTAGIVIGVDTNGFYIQSAIGDANTATSDGLFVFTTSAPTVSVGDAVNVAGLVQEVRPGNAAANLTTTQINSPSVSIVSSGNALPGATIIGTGGRLPPTDAFDSDGFTVFNPGVDAADFYESLEGMRVTVLAPLVTSATNGFGETFVVASGGVGATGVNTRGGITISGNDTGPDDYNPERIQLDDDSGLFAGFTPGYTQGDILSDVTGIFSYNFQNYELLVTQAVTISTDATAPSREVTALAGDADRVSIAAYNVQNLDPTDTRFGALASDIVTNLGQPDIISLEEIQDADGAGTGSNLSGTATANLLIAAIVAAGGPTYSFVEVAPTVANSTGGEPNGNIRNGFLYNAARVDYVADSAILVPGTAFTNSRSPLAAQFEFNDTVITAISVHSSSRIGSTPLFGSTQPPVTGGEANRNAQAAAIRAYIDTQLATDPASAFVVLGDFNGFSYETAIESITAGDLLTDLASLLPEEDRYSFIFDGNAQALDHILVSSTFVSTAQFDAVHLNSEQAEALRATDHDALVATLQILAPVAGATPGADVLTNPVANNAIDGLANFDHLDMSAFTEAVTLDTAAGTIVSTQGGNDTVINVEFFTLGSGDDIVTFGNSGFVVRTGGGDDVVTGGTGRDLISGGDGDDILAGGSGAANELGGGDGNDIYVLSAVGDSVFEALNQGNDEIQTTLTVLINRANVETLHFTDNGAHVGVGHDQNDDIIGGTGVDQFFGRGGDDSFRAGTGAANALFGQTGDDTYFIDAVGDSAFELVGEGTDTVVTGLRVHTLRINVENLSYTGADNFTGIGNASANAVTGGGGDDFLSGLGGDDILTGGAGLDLLIGGDGADIFRIENSANSDRILDFVSGTDKIALSNFAFSHSETVDYVAGTAATSTNSSFLYNSTNGVLSFDADGSGAEAAIAIANLGGGLMLTASDFIFYGDLPLS